MTDAPDRMPESAPSSPQAPVRADLGRPETPEERDERMRESSRLHRDRQTLVNLLWALGVSLAIVLVLILVVPRNDQPRDFSVDPAEIAAQEQPFMTEHLVVPEMPENWTSNGAELRTSADGVTEWYVGYVVQEGETPTGYVGMSQGIDANDTWVLAKLDNRTATGSIDLGGLTWTEYDHTDLDPDQGGNTRYALVAKDGADTYVVYGSHRAEQVQALATAVAQGR